MSKHLSMMPLLTTLALAAACGSGHNATGMGGSGGTGEMGGMGGAAGIGGMAGAAVYPTCASGQGGSVVDGICAPSGFPFVQDAFAHSNLCSGICTTAAGTTIHLSQPADGTLCLSGSNPNAGDATGILLSFTEFSSAGLTATHGTVLKMFNADVLGITKVRFTIDRPPPAGVSVWADTLHSTECNNNDCITWGFALASPITATGTTSVTTTASFTDFIPTPPQTFDTRALDAIAFDVGQGDFDFCVRDFQFLDASGAVVLPKP
jgi:hypothetical protein